MKDKIKHTEAGLICFDSHICHLGNQDVLDFDLFASSALFIE